jgi:hypothetical protein
MDDNFIKKECRLCKSDALNTVLPLTDSPLCDAYLTAKKDQKYYSLKLVQCNDCGFVQIDCVVDPEIIYRDYIYVTTSSSGLKNHFESYADDVFRYLKLPLKNLVVDIGSNEGTLLSFFQQKNCSVLGIEPSIETAKNATEKGIETLSKFFNSDLSKKIVENYGNANLITINNLFANIDDLHDFAGGLEHLLGDDGVLVIESSYLLDMVNNMVFDFIYHEHLSYFSIIPLVSFFKQFRIKLVKVEHVGTKGGSLRYYWAKESSNRPVDDSVSQFIAEEEKTGIDTDFFKHYEIRINRAKKELIDVLETYKGKKIVGYGASATSTTLISHFGLDAHLTSLVDDNPGKIRTYSPGYHIPVKNFDSLHEDPPDVVVILAWRFSDEIYKKISSLNCKIISPLPEFTILK